MNTLRILNCGLEGFCILLCLVLFIQLMLTRDERVPVGWFSLALAGCAGMQAGDLLVWGLSHARQITASTGMLAGSTLFFAALGLFLPGYFTFFRNRLADEPQRGAGLVLWLLSAAEAVIALLAPLTGAAFTHTSDGTLTRGPLFAAALIPALAALLLALWHLARAWDHLDRRARLSSALYLGLPLLCGIAQALLPNTAVLPVGLAVTLQLAGIFTQAQAHARLRQNAELLEEARTDAVQELTRRQELLTGEIIIALSSAVEAKDRYTNGHSQRVARYAREIVRRMGWSAEDQQKMYLTGLLHDVGKIRVPDEIINKPERLTDEEFAQVKLHTMVGYYILKKISTVCEFAIGARWHHERFDGKGYPNGLSGQNIPLIARILAVADAYDAMTSNRSYREIMSQADVRHEIEKGMGTQFDPEIAAVMLDMIDEDIGYLMRQPAAPPQWVLLVIDDDPVIHKFLSGIFRGNIHYKVRTALTSEQGLSILNREQVDLVLLDVELPGVGGFEMLTRIREDYSDIPVVFMTGDKDIDIIQKAEQMGVSDYLTKPLAAHMLLESIQNILFGSHMPMQGGGK